MSQEESIHAANPAGVLEINHPRLRFWPVVSWLRWSLAAGLILWSLPVRDNKADTEGFVVGFIVLAVLLWMLGFMIAMQHGAYTAYPYLTVRRRIRVSPEEGVIVDGRTISDDMPLGVLSTVNNGPGKNPSTLYHVLLVLRGAVVRLMTFTNDPGSARQFAKEIQEQLGLPGAEKEFIGEARPVDDTGTTLLMLLIVLIEVMLVVPLCVVATSGYFVVEGMQLVGLLCAGIHALSYFLQCWWLQATTAKIAFEFCSNPRSA
jgi:hypothetical protein